MSSSGPETLPAPAPTLWWARVHAALMPDYNRQAAAYWWLMVAAGVGACIHALGWLTQQTPSVAAQVLVGMAIAMGAGIFPVRVPHSTHSFAAGETFIFLLLLMHGPQAALLAAAGEAAVGSYRTSKRWTSRLASPAMAALAMWAAGTVFAAGEQALGPQRLDHGGGLLVVMAMLFALGYFFCNTLLVTAVARLKRRQWWRASDLLGVFGWVGIAYAGSGAMAVLLYLTYLQSGLGVLAATVPLLAMLLATLHYFFRQQEVADAVRRSSAEAA
ncbi:MAG: hypothetical protein H7Z19_22960, partial [Chitinophagaceae bacterium]|nr:hypothetical protein [Rubrivivax sp.]